jgi:hypothetical protein
MAIWRSISGTIMILLCLFPLQSPSPPPGTSTNATAIPEFQHDLRAVLSSLERERTIGLLPWNQRTHHGQDRSLTRSQWFVVVLFAPTAKIGPLQSAFLGPTPRAVLLVEASTKTNRSRARRHHHHGRLLRSVDRMASRRL